MCGIFGGIGQYNKDKIKMLAILNQERGDHATGFFNGETILKSAVPATEFIAEYPEYFKNRKSRYMMGHTRFATMGKKEDDKNAHPFNYGNIVGTHNGIVYNTHELSNTLKTDLDVDSEYIFYLLNERGNIDKALRELSGYWGLAWVDMSDPSRFYLSTHSNTLAYIKFNNVIYYSSDSEHLKVVFGYKAPIKEIPNNTLLSIDSDSLDIIESKLAGLKDSYLPIKHNRYGHIIDEDYADPYGISSYYKSTASMHTNELCDYCCSCLKDNESDNIVEELDTGDILVLCSSCLEDYNRYGIDTNNIDKYLLNNSNEFFFD